MRLLDYFNPEKRILKQMIKLRSMAYKHGYTVLPGHINGMISEFKNPYNQDWCSTPCNDDDIEGIYKYLIWAASKNGWSSDKLHYIEILYKKSKDKLLK